MVETVMLVLLFGAGAACLVVGLLLQPGSVSATSAPTSSTCPSASETCPSSR